MNIGFLGLGKMGTPMAQRISAKFPLTVWSRSSRNYDLLKDAGAEIAESPVDVLRRSNIVFIMLLNDAAIESVWTAEFTSSLHGKMIINTSSISAHYSQELGVRSHEAGGFYFEMPVSGGPVPAANGALVGLLACDEALQQKVQPVVDSFTSTTVYCGPVGAGLKMKYATNCYLIGLTAALVEAANLAKAQDLDLAAFGRALEAGPTGSSYQKMKLQKLEKEDWSAQAAVRDAHNNSLLVQSAACRAGIDVPVVKLSESILGRAIEEGFGEEDMVASSKVFRRKKAE